MKNKEKSEKTIKQEEVASDSAARNATSKDPSLAKEIPITLRGYFEESRVSPSAFFKVLRDNQITRFRSSDREEAICLIMTSDLMATRFCNLITQPSFPTAIDAWIWDAAAELLGQKLGAPFNPNGGDTNRVFGELLSGLFPKGRPDQKDELAQAEIWLRIGIRWFVERRSINVGYVAKKLQAILFPKENAASRFAQRVVGGAGERELRLAVAVIGLGDDMAKVAEEERDRERANAIDLRHRLKAANEVSQRLQFDLEDAEKRIAKEQEKTSLVYAKYEAERQHWGHDLTEAKAEQSVLLGERLGPLLEDVADALEMEPPAPEIALRRVRSALKLIEGAKE